MSLLIVESNPTLAERWRKHTADQGLQVEVAFDQRDAIRALQQGHITVLLLNVMLEDGSAFAVADYACFRFPDVRILFVTASEVFADGSIFNHVANARAYLPVSTPPSDLAAMVAHYAARG